jgi:hypothetical protein
LETVYRQLLDIQSVVVETGGLPNTYTKQAHGRWGGVEDQHPLRLCRATRYLTLGDRTDLYDVDLSDAHLVLALALVLIQEPELASLKTFADYLQCRETWLEWLRRELLKHGQVLSTAQLKGIARAWLYGAWVKRGSPLGAFLEAAPSLPAILKASERWTQLKQEIQWTAKMLATNGTDLSYQLTQTEVALMQTVGLKLSTQTEMKLQAWLYDGLLLIRSLGNPTDVVQQAVEEAAQKVGLCASWDAPGFKVKVKSVRDLCDAYLQPLGGSRP